MEQIESNEIKRKVELVFVFIINANAILSDDKEYFFEAFFCSPFGTL